MVRIAVHCGISPTEVFRWPASDIVLLAAFLSREPLPEYRQEVGLAQLAAIQVNSNRKKGSAPHKVAEFMAFEDAWKPKEDDEPQSLDAFAMSLGAVKRG